MNRKVLCGTCAFYARCEYEGERGQCRRGRPRPATYDDAERCGYAVWPKVCVTDWCGEWTARVTDRE